MNDAVPRPVTQNWDPEAYARSARFVADLGQPLVDLLDPRPGERVLDLGCGDGALTRHLISRGAIVVAVDASHAQVEAARRLGIDARVMDGQSLDFDETFNAVFSNAALHWMRRPVAVIDGIWRALRPGGRLVGEMGGHGNVAAVRTALYAALDRRGIDAAAHDPWYFPDAQAYRALLEERGFVVRDISLFDRPTPLPGDIADWLGVFAQSFLSAVDADARPSLVAEVRAAVTPRLRQTDGGWHVDYVRLRFAAERPGEAS